MNLFSKFKTMWKLISPFLFFLTVSFSTIMGLFTFVLNVSEEVKKIWDTGNFRNVEWSEKKFSQVSIEDEKWLLRSSETGSSFLYDYIFDNLTIEVDTTELFNFIENLGVNSGFITSEIYADYPQIVENLLSSEKLSLKSYQFNILNCFIVNKIYDDFTSSINVFPIRTVSTKINDLNQNQIKFWLAPGIDNTTEAKFLQKNFDTDFHVISQLNDSEIIKLNGNFIYVSPSDLLEFGLKIGNEYKLSIQGKIISTSIAGTAVSKTSITKEDRTNNIFANFDFLNNNNLIDRIQYGAYIEEAGADFLKASIYFNDFLNKYFVNDSLNLYRGNYLVNSKNAPYYTMYKDPLEIFYILSSLIVIFILLLIFVCYSWISIYTIKKQKETLWNFKANGAGNGLLSYSQIVGDIIPQMISFLLAVPLSFLVYKIFWTVGSNKYVFDLANSFLNFKSLLIAFIIFASVFFIYLIANFFIIKNKLKINEPLIKSTKIFKIVKNIFVNQNIKIGLAVSWPNLSKAVIFGITMLLTFWTIGFGMLLNSSLQKTATQSIEYMKPHKNASGQYLENTTDGIFLELDEYESINFQDLKEAFENNDQILFESFLNYLLKLNPLNSKIESTDVEWFLNEIFPEDLEKLIEFQTKLKAQILQLNYQYKDDFYPEIYFKNYPKFDLVSSFNLFFSNRVGFNFVLLKNEREIFNDFSLDNNEVVLTEELYFQFNKWGYIKGESLSLLLGDKNLEFKIKSIEQKIYDHYYIYGDYDYFMEYYYHQSTMRDNVFYTSNQSPLITEFIILPTINSEMSGGNFEHYIDSDTGEISDINYFLSDYLEFSNFLVNNAATLSGLPIYSSYILIVISFILISILISLTLISNHDIIKKLKQLGYKSNRVCKYIALGYVASCLLALIIMYSSIGFITNSITNLLENILKMNIEIYYDYWTFLVPFVIFTLFTSMIYISLKIYVTRVSLN